MIIEQLIFIVIAFALFVYIFLKFIQRNDSNYVSILAIQAIAIAINFIAVIGRINLPFILILMKYIFGIVIPIAVMVLEKNNIPLIQILNVVKAKIYLKLGNNKKAKEQLIKLVGKYPNNYIGHKTLAEIYEQEGGMRKAIDEYVQAIEINKKDYDSYYKVAELLNDLEKPDEASEMLHNLLQKKPEYIKASELLGDILISKEMYKEAVNVYQDALRYNPVSFELNYNLGIAYTMLNDFQNAKVCYERAADINSLSYNSKYSLAEIAMIFKELEEAEKYFMEAIEDDEFSADSYYELSKISLIKGDNERAIQYTKIAIDIDLPKIAKKIKKDPLFIPIIAKISIPFNIEDNKTNKSKLNKKEVKAKEHLEDMFDITRNLSYDDIEMMGSQTTNGKKKHKEDKIQNEYETERGEL